MISKYCSGGPQVHAFPAGSFLHMPDFIDGATCLSQRLPHFTTTCLKVVLLLPLPFLENDYLTDVLVRMRFVQDKGTNIDV
eukprot:4130192-Amphidinium_carterae.1